MYGMKTELKKAPCKGWPVSQVDTCQFVEVVDVGQGVADWKVGDVCYIDDSGNPTVLKNGTGTLERTSIHAVQGLSRLRVQPLNTGDVVTVTV